MTSYFFTAFAKQWVCGFFCLFFRCKTYIHLGHLCGVGRSVPVWPASLAVPGVFLGSQKCYRAALVWEPRAAFPFQWEMRSHPQCRQRQPFLPPGIYLEPPVPWDWGCWVTRPVLATSTAGMCALGAGFFPSNSCRWPWADPTHPLSPVGQRSQPRWFPVGTSTTHKCSV